MNNKAPFTIALDAMGGDHGPAVIVPGAHLSRVRHHASIYAALARFGPRHGVVNRVRDDSSAEVAFDRVVEVILLSRHGDSIEVFLVNVALFGYRVV